MKKNYFFLCLLFVCGVSVRTMAQTNPGTTNLTHQWTFDDGTAKDAVGTVNGTLQGAATISGKALVTSSGGYLTFDAAALAVNTYSELTAEVWFTSSSSSTKDFSMLAYFGNTTGTVGTNYFSICPARNDNFSRTAMSCLDLATPWASETGVNSTPYFDAKLHHMVATVNATNITFYIDGINIGTAVLSASNILSNIGTQFAYLAKGGYSNDPSWKGLIHKFSIYNKVLTDDNVLYLFQKGAEEQPAITTTASSLAFDTNYPAEIFSVSSANISSAITVTAPAGITVTPATIPANTPDVKVTAIYTGTAAITGNITLTSGSTVVTIPVKAVSDASCYKPLYNGSYLNIIAESGWDAGMNTLTKYGGWGAKEVVSIITDPANVYCGAASFKVGNGTSTGSGSLDVGLAGILLPNTTYHVKVMIKTIGGTFHLGVDAAPNVEKAIDTNGEWMPLEFTFATGATLVASPVMYINNWACTGLTAYVDNYELYVTPEPVITVSTDSYIADNLSGKSFKLSCKGVNLIKDIVITAPAGITVTPSTISKDSVSAQTFTATYDGATPVSGDIVLTSDTLKVKIAVKSELGDATCFTPLYPNKTNLVSDPYMNNFSLFGGWGTKSAITVVDSVYCGSRSGLIITSGSIDANSISGKFLPNKNYKVKAMVKTWGDFRIGISGIDKSNTPVEVTFNTNGVWKEQIIEFVTTDTIPASQNMYFNNWSLGGVRGYIDNWELYQVEPNAVENVKEQFKNIFVQNGKIVASFDADNATTVQFAVYNIQGTLVSEERFACQAGSNRKELNAPLASGMYVVRMTQNGMSSYKKVIK